MPSNLDSECSQLLHQPPDVGTSGPNFASEFGATDDDRSVIHEQLNNPPNAEIGLFMWRRPALSGVEWGSRPRAAS